MIQVFGINLSFSVLVGLVVVNTIVNAYLLFTHFKK